MKTVVLRRPGGPDVLETVDVPLPTPKADEAAIVQQAHLGRRTALS
jgi:NADPH:quinone reductase-like Zn-dependent oxidoreductase